MDDLVLQPERFVAGGDALARDADGRVVFVEGALPGETVTAEIIQQKKDWARARVSTVDVAAPTRVEPPCPSRRAGCGGCDWQHIVPTAQRDAKTDIVLDALRRIGRLTDPVVEQGPGVDADGYRTTLRVAATAEGRAGLRAQHSHDVIAAPECLVAHPHLRRVIAELELDAGVEVTVRVSVATGAVCASWDRSVGDVRGLPADALTEADAVLDEVVHGVTLRVSMGSFFQSGPAAAELLVAAVGRAAPELTAAHTVVDAYGGVGLFAATVARDAEHVIVVETSRAAVADARHNLAGRSASVVKGEVGGWRADTGTRVGVVIADPARSGLGGPGVGALARTEAPVIVLISCDPASLGRDTTLLGAAGYRHERSEVIDTFPHTSHVEVVSRFDRT